MIQGLHNAIRTGIERLSQARGNGCLKLSSETDVRERITSALQAGKDDSFTIAPDLTFFVIDSKLSALNHNEVREYSGQQSDSAAVLRFIQENIAEARRQDLSRAHLPLAYCEHFVPSADAA